MANIINQVHANRLKDIELSKIRNIFDKANKMDQSGKKIMHLEIGRPDFDTPQKIKDSSIRALEDGFVHYTANRGIYKLRNTISKKLKLENDIEVNPDENIIITGGCKQAIFNTFAALINEEDEVIIPTPSWGSYESIIKIFGGKPVKLQLDIENDFDINVEEIEDLITDKTKFIILCNPHNPTGNVIGLDILKDISRICQKYDLYVLSDEIYEKIIYDDFHYVSIASLPNMFERCITINGFSKAYAMDGWRLGYIVGPKNIIDPILKIHQNNASCVTTFVQIAGVEAYNNCSFEVSEMVKIYKARRDFIVEKLNAIKGVKCNLPKGSFYVFPRFDIKNMNSEELCIYLLENAHVASVPGSAFGEEDNIHLRFSYAAGMEDIEKGMLNVEEALQNLID